MLAVLGCSYRQAQPILRPKIPLNNKVIKKVKSAYEPSGPSARRLSPVSVA